MKQQLATLTDDQRDDATKLIGRLHSRIHTTLVGNYYGETSQDYEKVLRFSCGPIRRDSPWNTPTSCWRPRPQSGRHSTQEVRFTISPARSMRSVMGTGLARA